MCPRLIKLNWLILQFKLKLVINNQFIKFFRLEILYLKKNSFFIKSAILLFIK